MRKTRRVEASLKEKGVLPSVTTWMNLEDVTAGGIDHMRHRGANSMISRVWNLKQLRGDWWLPGPGGGEMGGGLFKG